MTAARHARDGQRRDDLTAAARDTWTLIRKWLRPALARYFAVDEWRALAGDVRALNAIAPDALLPLISRRACPRAAGGAPGLVAVAGAPEAPSPFPPVGAGASLKLRNAAPEAPAAPATPGAARPPWDAWPAPGTAPRYASRGAAGRRETIAMAVLRDPVPSYYLAHLARQDMAVMGA
jgi:hypothetical protein